MKNRKLRLIVDNEEDSLPVAREPSTPVLTLASGESIGRLTNFRTGPVVRGEYTRMGEDWADGYSVAASQVVSVLLSRVEVYENNFLEAFTRQLSAMASPGVIEDLTMEASPENPGEYLVRANVRLPPLRYISSTILLGSTEGQPMGAVVPYDTCSICDGQGVETPCHHIHDPEEWETLE